MKALFICTANVCRSPLAEGYLKHLLKLNPKQGIEVESAGVMALTGSGAFDCAIQVANISGFDISAHRARKLTPEIGSKADLILCMETWQARDVIELNPAWINKTALLGNYHSSKRRLFQIHDPRDFTPQYTLEVFELIRDSVDQLYSSL